MFKSRFPSPMTEHPDGLVAISETIDTDLLLDAYVHGIFPWPHSQLKEIPWFSPDPRGILAFEHFHLPRSLKKIIQKNPYQIKHNFDFINVLKTCADYHRQKNQETWLNSKLQNSYHDLFKMGFCYSVEAYKEEQLVGGIYGVKIHRYMSGESMFALEDNASKICLYYLIEHYGPQVSWLDIQMLTSVTESLGGEYISREDFLQKLKESLSG